MKSVCAQHSMCVSALFLVGAAYLVQDLAEFYFYLALSTVAVYALVVVVYGVDLEGRAILYYTVQLSY